jgi:hypothetical protein
MKKLLLGCADRAAAIRHSADELVEVHLKNHRSRPRDREGHKPSMIILTMMPADEFDLPRRSSAWCLAVKANIRIRALAPGKYPFMGEFNASTVQGMVIAE